ncbi:GerMN domain-containing protein [Desulfuromonas acetoxidans]|nr:GerMN domain-containing protein [Desulfuromonas acetoxidans]NVD25720.1 GerMN domain-containing protein [Desulfuromonas acetoxidans]NVE17016.1 GerMN domain-containing protein [Desulfuromonas acetoxidans]
MKNMLRWFGLLALVAFIAGVGAVFNPFNRDNEPEAESVAVVVEEEQPVQRDVVLYFGDPASPFLAQEERPIAECDDDLTCIEAIVRELVAGPQTELVPVLPAQALLLGVEIDEDRVVLDFNQALVTNLPAGCSSELLSVHALVNTLAANIPYVRRLVLHVEGREIKTLRGHVDLTEPVSADFSLVHRERDVPVVEDVAVPVKEQE